jgi:hypothetical protein
MYPPCTLRFPAAMRLALPALAAVPKQPLKHGALGTPCHQMFIVRDRKAQANFPK